MSFSSTPNHAWRQHNEEEARGYRVEYPPHAGHHHHHHHIDEPRDYLVRRSDTDATLCDSYPYYANPPRAYDGRHGNADRTGPRRDRVAEYEEVYQYAPARGVKGGVRSEFADEDVNGEAEEFIQMEHKKFELSKWMSSRKSG
ncbi:uncharacterized protein LOC115751347 [Rhodamnia argentea]|uniref:Uncharacterized protein LOC115751347 n=1 Tax=Rhodamnia argentea TaxID=178133 RepID=A0A8B8QD68_9MYRT|nr:uncharacterized protein LOC115751347 [Rhodamnia argentea]